MNEPLRIVTRKSALARVQCQHVADAITAKTGVGCDIIAIETKGDQYGSTPLPAIGTQGLFTAELEAMLRAGQADAAVHSMKDLPTADAAGITIGAVTAREQPEDVLVTRDGAGLDGLARGARVGTGSVRRAAQIRALRSDLIVESIRGNVPTRISRVDDGTFDAVVLAAAGLRRLGLGHRIAHTFSTGVMVPAPGQGALAIQCRANDQRIRDVLQSVADEDSTLACRAERHVLERLSGGCNAPIGVFAVVSDRFTIHAFVGAPDGSRAIRYSLDGDREDALALADALADALESDGAAAIIAAARA